MLTRRFETRKNVTPKSPVLYLLVFELTQNKGWSNIIDNEMMMTFWHFLTHCTFWGAHTDDSTQRGPKPEIASSHDISHLKRTVKNSWMEREGQIIMCVSECTILCRRKYIIFSRLLSLKCVYVPLQAKILLQFEHAWMPPLLAIYSVCS